MRGIALVGLAISACAPPAPPEVAPAASLEAGLLDAVQRALPPTWTEGPGGALHTTLHPRGRGPMDVTLHPDTVVLDGVELRVASVGRAWTARPLRAPLQLEEGVATWDTPDATLRWLFGPLGASWTLELASPPRGVGEVRVEVTLAADDLRVEPERATWSTPDGRGYVMDRLAVLDAGGRLLPSRFEPDGDGLAVVFDDTGATWPVTVDPVAFQRTEDEQGYTMMSTTSGFGTGVAVHTSRAWVGQPAYTTNDGRVYAFQATAYGWRAESTTPGGADVQHGSDLCVSGATLIVGEPGAASGVGQVTRRSATSSSTTTTGTSPGDAVEGRRFGAAVACDATRFAVAAPDAGSVGAGAVFVYTSAGTKQATLPAPSVASGFGADLAILGDVLVVGAPTLGTHGTIYVYRNVGSWTLSQQLTPPAWASGRVGSAVTLDATTLYAGAPDAPDGGRVAVWTWDAIAATFLPAPDLLSPTPIADGKFGAAVAWAPSADNTGRLWVGASGEAAAHVLHGTTFAPLARIAHPAGTSRGAGFGARVAAIQGRGLVGGPTISPAGDAIVADEQPDGTWVRERLAPPSLTDWTETGDIGIGVSMSDTLLVWDYEYGAFDDLLRGALHRMDGRWSRVRPRSSSGTAAFVDGNRTFGNTSTQLLVGDGLEGESRSPTVTAWDADADMAVAGDVRAFTNVLASPSAPPPGTEREYVAVDRYDGTQWVEEARWHLPIDPQDDVEAPQVAIDGDTLVVSAPLWSPPLLSYVGQLWVYERIAGDWVRVASLAPPAPTPTGVLGFDLDVRDRDFIVAAAGDTSADADGGYAAWVWERSATGAWEEAGRLEAVSGGALSAARTADVDERDLDVTVVGEEIVVRGLGATVFDRDPAFGWAQRFRRTLEVNGRVGYTGTLFAYGETGGFQVDTVVDTPLTFVVDAITPRPTGEVSYAEGAPALTLLPLAELSGTLPGGATVQAAILGRFDGTFERLSSTSGTWDSASGQLTLGSSTSLSTLQDLLRGLKYQHTGTEVTPGVRRIAIAVDGDVVGRVLVDVGDVNDRPTVDLDTTTTRALVRTWTEGDPPVWLTRKPRVVDTDDTTLQRVTASILPFLDEGDLLEARVTLAPISITWDGAAGVLTLEGPAPASAFDDALATLTYTHGPGHPLPHERVVEVVAWDAEGPGAAATLTLQAIAVNLPPEVRLSALGEPPPVAWTEGGGPVRLVPSDATVLDPDDLTLVGLTARLAPLVDSGDEVLAATVPPGLNSAFDGTTLSITGAGSLATYEAVLRSLTWDHTGAAPSPAPRAVEIRVNDPIDASPWVRVIVSLSLGDTAPSLDLDPTAPGVDADVVWVEDLGPNEILSGAAITDADGGPGPTRLVATLRDARDGSAEALGAPTAPAGLLVSVDGATVTWTGTAPVATWTAALRGLSYTHSADDPTPGTRSVDVGLDGGPTAVARVDVRAVDDPPTLDLDATAAGSDATAAISEGEPPVVLLPRAVLTDADSPTLSGATVSLPGATPHVALAATASGAASVAWEAGDGVLTIAGSTPADLQAVLRSLTLAILSDDPPAGPLAVRVDVPGAPSRTVIVAVTAVDDPTVLTPSSGPPVPRVTWREDDAPVPILPELVLSDADDEELAAADVTWTAPAGDAELVRATTTGLGTPSSAPGRFEVTARGSLTAYEALLRGLTFNGAAEPTAGVRRLAVSVRGPEGAVGTAAVEVEVIPVDDPAVVDLNGALSGRDHTAPLVYATDVALSTQSAEATDPDTATWTSVTAVLSPHPDGTDEVLRLAQPIAGWTATWDDATATLTVTGAGTAAQASDVLRALRYRNDAAQPTAVQRIVSVVAATDTTSAPAQARLEVAPTAPSLDLDTAAPPTGLSVTWVEDGGPVTLAPRGLVRDDDGDAIASLTVTLLSPDPTATLDAPGLPGGLTLQRGAGTLTLVGPATAETLTTALQRVTYDATDQAPTSNTTVRVQVEDASGALSPQASLLVVRTPVNDPPVVDLDTSASGTPTVDGLVGGGFVDLVGDASILDPDDDRIVRVEVRIAPFEPGVESLTLSTPGGAGFAADASGTLVATGTATLSAWADALEGLSWRADAPPTNLDDRTITVFAADDDGPGPEVALTLRVVVVTDTGETDAETDDSDDTDAETDDTEVDSDDTDVETDDTEVETDDTDTGSPSTDDAPACGCATGAPWPGVVALIGALAAARRRRHSTER